MNCQRLAVASLTVSRTKMAWTTGERSRTRARAVLVAAVTYLVFGLSFGATAQGAGIQAEQVLTEPMTGNRGTRERVEVGRWLQDERGRTRYDFDEWTHIVDPVARVEWKANSKRGYFSAHELSLEQARNAVAALEPLGGQGIDGMSTTDLGTREVNGFLCDGALHEIVNSRRGLTIRFELEEWFTNAFGFPLRVKRVFRMHGRGGESTTELRNIVLLKDDSFEEHFRPNKDWREVDGEVERINTGRMGFFAKEAKYGATTRIGRRSDRRPPSRDPFENLRKSTP